MEIKRREVRSYTTFTGRWWEIPEFTKDDFIVTVSKLKIEFAYQTYTGTINIMVEPNYERYDEIVAACADSKELQRFTGMFSKDSMVAVLPYTDRISLSRVRKQETKDERYEELRKRMTESTQEAVDARVNNFIEKFNKGVSYFKGEDNNSTARGLQRLFHGAPKMVKYADEVGDHKSTLAKIVALEGKVAELEDKLDDLYHDLHKERCVSVMADMESKGWAVKRNGVTAGLPEEYVGLIKTMNDSGKMLELFPTHRHSLHGGEGDNGLFELL